jgi:glycosyltransferase involved in cell wall biosynthesis
VWDLAVGLSKLDVTVHLFGTPGSQAPPSSFLHYVPREDWSSFTWGEIKPATIYRKLLLEEVDVLHDWSIHPDEELIVFENGRFKRTKIGEFVDSLIERKFGKLYSTDMFDYLRLPNCADFKVFGCDYNGNISLVKVRGVARHRTVGELIEVELEGGLKIRLTPNHDLFTISNWNRIVRVKPKEGIKVVVPQRLPRELPDLNEVKGYRISDELLIAFGLWLADGCYDIAGVKFYPGYVAEEREIRQVLQKVARQYNAKFIEYPSNPLACEISSKEFKQMMVDLGFNGDACSKRVPDWVFSLSDRQVGLLLKGYFSGDGCVCVSRRKGYNVNMAQISFSTTSHQLAEDIRLLLLFLGIFTSKPLKRINFKPKSIIRNGKVHIIKTGTVYQVSIAKGYFETFLQKVGFLHEMKNEIVRANLPKWDYGRKRHDLKLRRIKKIRKLDEKPLYLYDIELEFSDGRPINQRYVCSEILVHNTHLHWLADFRYWRGDGKAVSTPWGNIILRPLVKRNLVCLPEGLITCINTEGRLYYKDISEVQVGERVLTHRGRFRRVIRKFRRWYEGEIVNIKVSNMPFEIKATPEHPFRAFHFNKNKGGWVPAEKLEVHDYIAIPKVSIMNVGVERIGFRRTIARVLAKWKERNPYSTFTGYPIYPSKEGRYTGELRDRWRRIFEGLKLNPDFLWLCGHYIAEGSSKGGRALVFSVGKHKVQKVLDKIRKCFGVDPAIEKEVKNTRNILLHCRPLAYVFRRWFGNHSEHKTLPSWVFKLNHEQLAHFLQGLWEGDGYIQVRHGLPVCSYYTISPSLAFSLQLLLMKNDIVPSLFFDNKNRIYILSVAGKHNMELMASLGFPKPKSDQCDFRRTPRFRWTRNIWLPIRHVKREFYRGFVWNLEVEQDSTFTVQNVVSHNCWSRFQRDLAVKQYGFPETTKYVWGGTNVEFYCPDPDKPYEKSDFILFFARMHPSKRVDIAYELARRFPNQRFVVAGSFSASPDHAYFGAYYKQAFERLPNVKIVPDVTHEEKRELYRKAKALLFPSISECFGLVAVEALSCGTPVICSRDGAFPEIVVDGKTGFLCGSLEEYERALRNVDMLSPEACVRDARQRFSRERAAREYLEIYKKVANGEFF